MNRVLFKSHTAEWRTPQAVYEALDTEFGFTFDPCPIGAISDGAATLFSEWGGQRVFCNPPYGPGITKFLRMATQADLAVFLLPARTDTRWFHEIVLPFAKEIRFIKRRLRFGGATVNAPFPSMIVVFSKCTPDLRCLR